MRSLKNTGSKEKENYNFRDPDSFIVFSLEKIIDSKYYGLCIDSNHAHSNNQNAKRYNTALMRLFKFLSHKKWSEVYSIPKRSEFGHERLCIGELNKHVKDFFVNKCSKSTGDKCDVFRFGSQNFRACGFRVHNVFYLVCIDYDYTLYNHGK